jgi:translation initiation factor 2D
MSELILPFLPTFTPAQTASLQIKKTSWKNLKKFIKAMEKEQLLKSKDRNGGELVVLDIDFAERAFKDFTPYPLPRKEVAGGGKEGSAPDTAASSGGDPSVGQHLRRLVFYKPKEKLAPIFEPSKSRYASDSWPSPALTPSLTVFSVRDTYSASELRSIVVTYLEAESLIVPTNKRLVKLNPVLSNAVFDTASSLDNEVMAKGTVPRDILIDRVLTLCTSQWAILRGDQSKDEVRPKTGAVPSVNILLETRSGNKVVTKLSGVEAYFIHPQPLAEELQKVCASATSVSQLIGSSPKNPVMEILVQGPQRDAVMKALEKRGVNRQWISVIDKTKGKKR